MTIMIEPVSWPDKLLAQIGKRRAVRIPGTVQPYGYYVALREGFLRALFRRKGSHLPDGWVYWDQDELSDRKHRTALDARCGKTAE